MAVYGTLAPGRPNHHVVADLGGRWIEGTVRGILRREGWGADLGYPGIVLHDQGPEVPVQVLESPELPANWSRLDDFEGPGYRRTPAIVLTADGEIVASIYQLAPQATADGPSETK